MKPLLTLFWQICLLRRGPEAIPAISGLLGIVVIANLVASFVLAFSFPEALVADVEVETIPASPVRVLASLLAFQGTVAGFLWLATNVRNVAARFPATATAYFGCDLILTLVQFIVVQLTPILGVDFIRTILVVLLIWSLAILGFIIQRAISLSTSISLGIAFVIMVIGLVIGEVAIRT